MSSTPPLLLWFLDHPPPSFPRSIESFWTFVEDYITQCPDVARPATEAELDLLSKVIGVNLQYAEHMGAVTAARAGAGMGAKRGAGSSKSPTSSSISLPTAQKMHQLTQQVQMAAITRLHDLLCCEVTDQALVMDALQSPAVVELAVADLAACCEYLYQQKEQQHPASLEKQQQQPSVAAGRRGMQQTGASSANKAHAPLSGPASFAGLLLYPDHEQIWVPGGQQGRKWHLEALQTSWEGSEGKLTISSIASLVLSAVHQRINILAAPGALGKHTLSTATHLKLLLEVLVLVGWVQEQEGAVGVRVEPIMELLKVSLLGAKREEREVFVTSRGKLLLSVLQLLLRKVDAAGRGDGDGCGRGVEEGFEEAERLTQLYMVRNVVSLLRAAAAAHAVRKDKGGGGDAINEVCEGRKSMSTSGGASSSRGDAGASSSCGRERVSSSRECDCRRGNGGGASSSSSDSGGHGAGSCSGMDREAREQLSCNAEGAGTHKHGDGEDDDDDDGKYMVGLCEQEIPLVGCSTLPLEKGCSNMHQHIKR